MSSSRHCFDWPLRFICIFLGRLHNTCLGVCFTFWVHHGRYFCNTMTTFSQHCDTFEKTRTFSLLATMGASRSSSQEPEGARRIQEEPGGASRNHQELERFAEDPEGPSRSQGPGGARMSHGGARRTPNAALVKSSLLLDAPGSSQEHPRARET